MILQKTYQALSLYCLVVTIVLVYSSTLTSEPLTWQDDSVISFLNEMKKGDITAWENQSVRPLPMLVFSFLYGFGDGSIFLFHLFNILFHASNTVLIFFFLGRLKQSFPLSFLTAVLFALHPLQTGTVSWLSQFPVILSLTILILSAWFYLEYRETNNSNYFWMVGILAVMYHATVSGGIVFVAMLFFVDYLTWKKMAIRLFYEKIPFVLLAFISFSVSHITILSLYSESVNVVRFGIVEGLHKIFAPVISSGISPLQSIVESTVVMGYSYYPMIVPFVVLIVLWTGKNHRTMLISMIGFLLAGLPLVSGVERKEWLLNSDSYYLPSVFIFYSVAYGFNNILNRSTILKFKYMALSVVVIALTYQTFRSAKIWQSNISFWNTVKTEYPNNAFVLNKLGSYYFSKFEIENALSNYSQSIGHHPRHYESYTNRGLVYLHLYETDSAKADFRYAINIFPQDALAYYNIALVYNVLSEWDSAIVNFSKAIDREQDFTQALNNRGNTFATQKKYVQAFADYEKAVRIDPTYSDAYGNRALIFLETGNATDALLNFSRQNELSPRRFDVLIHLGLTHILVGDSESAGLAFSKAIKLDSVNAKMYLSGVTKTFLRRKDEIMLGNSVLSKFLPKEL